MNGISPLGSFCRQTSFLILFGIVSWVLCPLLRADLVYDQFVPYVPGAADLSAHIATENFVLENDVTVTDISIMLKEDAGTGATDNGILEGFGGLGWAVYGGVARPTGNPLSVGSLLPQNGVLTDTGMGGVEDVFQFDFSIPALNLAAGSYWLALIENNWGVAHDGTTIRWLRSNPDLDASYRHGLFTRTLPVPGESGFHDDWGAGLTLRVYGVPEPASSGLLILAVGGLSLVRRHRVPQR